MRRVSTQSVIVFAVAILSYAALASADTIIYQDNFGTSGALMDAAPQVALGQFGGTAGATWNVAGPNYNWTKSGGAAVKAAAHNAANEGDCVQLPFTPQDGHVYTYSMNMTCASGASVAMGFSRNSLNYGPFSMYGMGYTALWPSGAGNPPLEDYRVQAFLGKNALGADTDYLKINESVLSYGGAKFSLVLDTKTNPNDWTLEWRINGVSKAGPQAISQGSWSSDPASADALHYLWFGTYEPSGVISTGSIDNFSLTTDAVPEPSAVALLVTSLIGLLAYAWRKRR